MATRTSSGAERRGLTPPPSVLALLVVNCAVLGYEILRVNNPDALTVRLLGVPTAAGLVAVTALWAGYRAVAERRNGPLMRSVARWVTESERELATGGDAAWQVRIRNAGLGVAVIDRVRWVVQRGDDELGHIDGMPALHKELQQLGLHDAIEFWIANYSPGAALGPNEERCYFECARRALPVLSRFEAVIEFHSVFGGRYEKVVSLLPRPGASTVQVVESRLHRAS